MALSPEHVHRRLAAAAARQRWSGTGRHLLAGTAAALFFLIVFLAFDTRFHLGAFGRWMGFACIVVPLLAGIARALPAWHRPSSELALARRIEDACPDAGNTLVNAIQFDRELPVGSAMRAAVFSELADPFGRVNWARVFDLRLIRRLAAALALTALVVFLWGVLQPAAFVNSAARVFLPASRIAPLTRTRVDALAPGNASIVHGGELALSARLGGEIPRTAWVRFRETGAGAGWRRELMEHEVATADFTYHWRDMNAPLEYFVEAGDVQTAVYEVAVRPPTAVRTRTAEIEPPAYARLPKRTVVGLQTFDGVLAGSRVTLTMDFNGPVESLSAIETGQPCPSHRIDDRRWLVPFTVRPASRSLTLSFRDPDGATTTETLPVTVRPDLPPAISVTDPEEGRDLTAAPGATLPVRFSATDDFGLHAVGLYRSSTEKPDAELVQDFPAAGGQKTFAGAAQIPLARFVRPGEDRATFCLVARDDNNVSGPGLTVSRPLTVSLTTADAMRQQAADAAAKLAGSLQELVRLQQTNLDATQAALAAASNAPSAPAPGTLLDRQIAVGDMGQRLAAGAGEIAPGVRETLRALAQQEMPAAVLALRNAASADPSARAPMLNTASGLETIILARLRGSPERAQDEAKRGVIRDVIAGVDGLLREQRGILKETPGAANAAVSAPLSKRQDALADQSTAVRKGVEKSAGDSSLGDADFRARLGKVAAMFGEFKIYEEMLSAADALEGRQLPAAQAKETGVAANLAKMADLLHQWQLSQAGAETDKLRAEAEKLKAQLNLLADLQRGVLEKSRELARKDQFSPEDRSAVDALSLTKDKMGKLIEGMLTDAAVFPDMNISNQLRGQLTSVFEDVKQTDLAAIAKNALKPTDIRVQKEDGLLKAIENMKKIPEDMEMFLPNSSNTANWLAENFDKTEIPKLDNLALPDEMTDLIGDLQKEQESIADKVQGAASNQVMKAMQQGGVVMDGPQSGYSAQGKSSNQKPLDIEQSGRSSGGREGESNGEMVGKSADDLEGRQVHARRTSDPMQSGSVADPSGKTADARATGGGKAGGFSQREGMDGDAPLRGSNAPRQGAASAQAAAQAILAAKTSQKAAAASLLFLRGDRLSNVAGMMQESESALREGRLGDFQGLHKKIVAQLDAAKGEITGEKVLSLGTGGTGRAEGREVLGGGEGEAPAPYKDRVADYYRSLTEEK